MSRNISRDGKSKHRSVAARRNQKPQRVSRNSMYHRSHGTWLHRMRNVEFDAEALLRNDVVAPQQWHQALLLGREGFNELVRIRRQTDAVRSGLLHRAGARPLSAPNFAGLDLSAMDLRGFDFTDASFNDCNLAQTDLRETKLLRTQFENANLRRTDLRQAAIRNVDFARARIVETDFRLAVFRACKLYSGRKGRQVWTRPLLDGTRFIECTIAGLRITDAEAAHLGVRFVRCRITKQNIYARDIWGDRADEQIAPKITGNFAHIIVEGGRIHALRLRNTVGKCELVLDQTVYAWARLGGISRVTIRNDDLRDHGGQLLFNARPKSIDAPRWTQHVEERPDSVGQGLVLACVPARVQLGREMLASGDERMRYQPEVSHAKRWSEQLAWARQVVASKSWFGI